MSNQYWLDQEKLYLSSVKKIEIPNNRLDKVDRIIVRSKKDLEKMPNGGGCYWLWTTEPVRHYLHKKATPNKFRSGEIIYNGIAKDDVKGRVFHHLFGYEDAGWSGISLDIYTKPNTISHRKKACSTEGKVPFIIASGKPLPIKNKITLLKLYLSKKEKDYIKHSKTK